MAAALDLAVVGRTDGRRRRTGRAPPSPRSARHGRSRTSVSWTADGRPRHGRRDWVPDLEVALLRDSYPGPRSGRPPSSGAVRGRQMNSVRRSRVLEMDVWARGCRPTGCGSLIRGGALCESSQLPASGSTTAIYLGECGRPAPRETRPSRLDHPRRVLPAAQARGTRHTARRHLEWPRVRARAARDAAGPRR